MRRGDPKGNHWEQVSEREGKVKIETTKTTDESSREREVVRVNSANDRNNVDRLAWNWGSWVSSFVVCFVMLFLATINSRSQTGLSLSFSLFLCPHLFARPSTTERILSLGMVERGRSFRFCVCVFIYKHFKRQSGVWHNDHEIGFCVSYPL